MPRTSKPDLVRKLKGLWDNYFKSNCYLKSIEIRPPIALRGIVQSELKINFPVTIICGPNGTGKTTFLTLGVLAFHAISKPRNSIRKQTFYDFTYFFRSSIHDRHLAGICIVWRYTNGLELIISKGAERWMRYIKNNKETRRPQKGTEFVPISRVLPAFEKSRYSGYFSKKSQFDATKMDEELQKYMKEILQRPYTSIAEFSHSNTTGNHTISNYNDIYTSFNAGAGEECIVRILQTLLSCPQGSIVAIEEIEIGLHPSTLNPLIRVVLEIAYNRKLQILITSHSPDFLRSCPKETLILAERAGDKVKFINEPNVEYAIERVGGQPAKKVCIICEDPIARMFVEHAIPRKLSKICRVIQYGSKDELISKAEHAKVILDGASKILIAWDGDTEDKKIVEASEKEFLAAKLPGNKAPELYIIDSLNAPGGFDKIIDHYDLDDTQIQSISDKINSLTDHHDLFYVMSEEIGCKEDELTEFVVRSVYEMQKSQFAEITTLVESAAQ